ncbi:hypothetical protein EV128_11828 [Rhizobium azibense]|nr:hypothetical protein EV128_11828 [Rhizobium azibense]
MNALIRHRKRAKSIVPAKYEETWIEDPDRPSGIIEAPPASQWKWPTSCVRRVADDAKTGPSTSKKQGTERN